ncbi:Transcription factor [Aspergillus sp. HF37]|nr:Transcription factor [Aspergillus sp. HF37]
MAPDRQCETLSGDGYDGALLSGAGSGQSRWVSSLHYALLADEIHDVKMLLGDQVRATPVGRPLSELPASPFPLYNGTEVNLAPWLPRSAEDCFSLLEIFYSHVDPMIRLVHKPSLTRRLTQYVREAYDLPVQEATDEDDLSRPVPDTTLQTFEPFAFAVFYSAINSLTPDFVFQRFAAEKETLLSQFQTAIELGLGRENFLTTPNIEVLQAFMLLLTCQSREDDMSRTWTLLGLATRIALSQGLHREPSLFLSSNIDVVQIELRRRLWHQICYLDFRSAEARGQEPTIADDDYTTLLPRNVNDEDLIEGSHLGPLYMDLLI